MSRRLNRYTGQDEDLNRALRQLARERRRAMWLGCALVAAVGWAVFLQIPVLPIRWWLGEDRVCLVVNWVGDRE